MSLTSSVPPTTELAQAVLQQLTAKYPELQADIESAPRLLSALDAVARTTDLTAEQIYDGLTARELATAQRPIGVLISRCTELIDNACSPNPNAQTQNGAGIESNAIAASPNQQQTQQQTRQAQQLEQLAQQRPPSERREAMSARERTSLAASKQTNTSEQMEARTIGVATLRTATRETITVDTYAYQLPSTQRSEPPLSAIAPTSSGHEGSSNPNSVESHQAVTSSGPFIPELARLPRRVVPRYGVQHTLYRVSGGLVHLRPGRRERKDTELFSRIASPVVGPSNVIVVGLKGGVGKTTVSLALGHTFATFRNDRVIALDASPDPGTLGQRVTGAHGASVRELIERRGQITSYSDIRSFAVQQETGLEILSSDNGPLGLGPLSPSEYRTAIDCLCAYFNLIITDSGAGVSLPSLHGLLGPATQLVLVTAPMVDAGWSTSVLLDWLDQKGHAALVANTTIVVNHVQRRVDVKTNDFDRYFLSRCRSLVHIPWDASLAAGGNVSLEHFSRKARQAYRCLAATIAEGFAGSPTLAGPLRVGSPKLDESEPDLADVTASLSAQLR